MLNQGFKTSVWYAAGRAAAIVAGVLAFAGSASAQTVPAGFQDYFITGNEEHIWRMMEAVRNGDPAHNPPLAGQGGAFPAPAQMRSVVALTASADNQIVYYDHWEDGLEANLLTPTQATTLVLGDGNNANGRVCDFTRDARVFPCNGNPAHDDVIFAGTYVVFNSDQGLSVADGGACTAGLATPSISDVFCSIRVVPRNVARIRFDGGDHVLTAGGPVSVAHVQDPATTLIGDAAEVLSRQTVGNAFSYSVPIGADLFARGAGYESMRYDYLDLVAFDDNTQVTVVSPGGTGGTVSFTLNKGQHWSSQGYIDAVANAALRLTINSGTKVSTNGPITGIMFAGQNGGTWGTRHFALLPDILHGTDYVTTAPGDDTTIAGNRPQNLYIFNPDPLNSIVVTTTDTVRTLNITIPPNSLVDYRTAAGGADVPGNSAASSSTVRLTSNRPFWGVSAYSQSDVTSDWGHSWLATRFLTADYTVAYAPGTQTPAASVGSCGVAPCGAPGAANASLNRNPIFVAATQNNTHVKVNLNANGQFEFVDLNGDDCPDNGDTTIVDLSCETPPVVGTCPALTAGACSYRIDTLQSLKIFNYKTYDNSGTRIVADKPVAVAWGQDTDRGQGSDPSPDAGYTVYPAGLSFIDPVLTLDKTANPTTVSVAAGGQVTYTLRAKTYQWSPLTGVAVADLLPATVPRTAFVTGQTLITYPDGSTSTTDPTISIPTSLTVSSLTSSGVIASATTAGAHNLVTGDYVTIAGATQAPYNGTYTITKTGANTFTYVFAGSGTSPATGSITAIQARVRLSFVLSQTSLDPNQEITISYKVNLPAGAVPARFTNNAKVSANMGGSLFEATASSDVVRTNIALTKSVDIASPQQGTVLTYTLTTQNSGTNAETNVTITDAVPTNTTFVPCSISTAPFCVSSLTAVGTAAQATTTMPHGLQVGAIVVVAGATNGAANSYNGRYAVTAVTPTTFNYTTNVAPGVSPATGTITASPMLSLSSLTGAGATATATTSVAHGFANGQIVTIAGATSAGANNYNGSFAITVTGATTFTYTMAAASGSTPAGGLITATPALTLAAGALTSAGTTATVNFANHGFAVGDFVTISGATSAGANNYNGTFRIATVPTVNSFTYTMTAASGSSPAGGTIRVTRSNFVGSFQAAQNAIVWNTANYPVTTPITLTFQVRVNPGVPAGTVISNYGAYGSAQTPSFNSNTVQSVVVAPSLVASKTGTGTVAVTSASWAANTATLTAANHNLVVGDSITVSGINPAGYNGTFTVATTPTANTFTYALGANPGAFVSGGTVSRVTFLPGDTATFHVLVQNTGTSGATNVRIDDAIPANSTYVAGSGAFSINGGAFTALTDAGDADAGTVPVTLSVTGITRAGVTATATTSVAHGWANGSRVVISGANQPEYNGAFVIATAGGNTFTYTVSGAPATPATGTITATRPRFLLPALNAGESLDFRFQVTINNPCAGCTSINNQATVSSSEIGAQDTNLVSLPVGANNATVTGHVFLDSNGDGVQQGGEPNIANLDVVVTDSAGRIHRVTTNASGNYSVVLPAGNTTLAVDKSDPDFPSGATLTTGNDPQTVAALANNTVASGAVGFSPAALGIAKASNAGGSVVPGQTVSYTVTLTNNSTSTQTGISISDAMPTGTSYVAGSAVVSNTPAIRVTEYRLADVAPDLRCGGAAFTGTSCTLTLNQPLEPDYFVVVQGADSSAAADTSPSRDDVSLTADPFGSGGGQLGNTGANNTLTFTRGGSTGGQQWEGVITVVECLADCTTAGFKLRDVRRVAHGAATTTGTVASAFSWATGAPNLMLMGGTNGAGCDTADNTPAPNPLDHKNCFVRLFPSATNTINWTRDATGASSLAAATSTVMVLEWGSQWTVQRTAIVNGNNGGAGANATGEYNTTMSVTGITRVGAVATATTAASHGLTTGDTVTIAGATQAAYNVTATITVTSATQFTYAVAGAPATPATTGTSFTARKVFAREVGLTGAALTNAGTTATATTPTPHGFSNGDVVTISGATNAAYNGTFTIATAGPTATTFTYTMGSNPGAAGGSVARASKVITTVARANTWVWGTGTTANASGGQTQRSSEGVLLTLGDGVAKNANESLIAAGIESTNNAINFDVYALTHAGAAVDHEFKTEGAPNDAANLTSDVTVAAAGGDRMALVYNGMANSNMAFPRPLFSARYLNNTTVRLERQRSGDDFAAWVQGVDFAGITAGGVTVHADGSAIAPPSFVDPVTDDYTLAPGKSMTVTFQALVNSPLASGINSIVNGAQAQSDSVNAVSASVTDSVVRPAVLVEPDNATFVDYSNSVARTVTFAHTVTNTSAVTDSYNLTLTNERGFKVELLSADGTTVIATDTNGNGVWDCSPCTISTGNLAAGATINYQVRITVPADNPAGTAPLNMQATTRLTATSVKSAAGTAVSDYAQDEITIRNLADLGPVVVSPDHSGIVNVGGSIAYTHTVTNRTGAAATFDLVAPTSQAGWTSAIYRDTNGNGVYDAGVDTAIAATNALANGASQVVFVVVTSPNTATPGQVDLTSLTATSQTNATQFGSAFDTTTVVAATALDLSGGGTRAVAPGITGVYPGTLQNLGTANDRYNFTLSPSNLHDTSTKPVDGLTHPTELAIDTNGDGGPDFVIARDDDGDGTWDFIAGGGALPGGLSYNTGCTAPCVQVAPGAANALAYELRRTTNPAQTVPFEFVTLSATSTTQNFPGTTTKQSDSITATNLLAAVTRASIRGLRVDPAGVVEFATGMQRRTRSFNVYEVADRHGAQPVLLNAAPIASPAADSLAPILYRVETRPLTTGFLMIEEIETTGRHLWKGPFTVGDEQLAKGLERIQAQLDRSGVRPGKARVQKFAPRPRGRAQVSRTRHAASRDGVRIEVADSGIVEIPMAELEAAGLPGRVGARSLQLTNLDRAVPFSVVADPNRGELLRFAAEELATDYTGDNVYLLTWNARPFPMSVPLTRSADARRTGFVRVEKTFTYVAAAPDGNDPFLWDQLVSNGASWPYVDWDPTGESGWFDLAGLATGSSAPIAVRVRLVGMSDHHHAVEARINGFVVGSVAFDGFRGATLVGTLPASLLLAANNQLNLVYNATGKDGAASADGVVYLDYVDLAAPVSAPSSPASVTGLSAYDGSLPSFRRVEYLIVTHPDFREAADRIASLKEAEGLSAAVVETDNAYDRWSGGIVEARAIQALIREAAAKSGRLKYVLLVGDDTFDPQDLSGFGARVFVPSLLSRDSGFGRIPSENLYADTDGDGAPDLAIGRLPAQTAAEAAMMADKIANQAQLLAAQPDKNIFAVDNPRNDDAQFRAEAEEMALLIDAHPQTTTWADVEQGTEEARAALLGAWQSGARYTHYFGHGGPEIWADEHLLTVEDVQGLGDALKPSVVMMWACESQWYLNLWGPSLGEALYLVPNGGALASFGPSGITPPATHRVLFEKVYKTLGSGQPLGEIIRKAKKAALAEQPSTREVIDGFNLIGDPALKLPPQQH